LNIRRPKNRPRRGIGAGFNLIDALSRLRHGLSVNTGALIEAIMSRPRPTRLVAIDAPGGAGKSTFAAQLAEAAGGAPVIHTDDITPATRHTNEPTL
jgi:hypothetical protein